jgi:S1-C subfamily serine protease
VYEIAAADPDASLRFDVAAPSRDVDLWLASGKPALTAADAEVVAATSRGLELLVTIPSRDLQEPQHLFLTVSSPLYPDSDSIPFQLYATAGTEAPPLLAARPVTWPDVDGADPLQRALRSTVEIHAGDAGGWGSGVLLSASGYILTNDHVVEGPRGEPWEPNQISIGMTLDPSEPAVELFHAEVVARDADKDLALLRVVSGVYGNPLPHGKPLPYVRDHRDAAPELGESLTVIGYPGTGGDTSRPSISLSRGIVSGFVRAHGTSQIKTDAEISFGNSGGPVIDSSSRLLGVATFFVEEQGGRLGYIVPWSAVPQAWKEMLAALPSSSATAPQRDTGFASRH